MQGEREKRGKIWKKEWEIGVDWNLVSKVLKYEFDSFYTIVALQFVIILDYYSY